jgi:hypothetical protein
MQRGTGQSGLIHPLDHAFTHTDSSTEGAAYCTIVYLQRRPSDLSITIFVAGRGMSLQDDRTKTNLHLHMFRPWSISQQEGPKLQGPAQALTPHMFVPLWLYKSIGSFRVTAFCSSAGLHSPAAGVTPPKPPGKSGHGVGSAGGRSTHGTCSGGL